MLKKLHTRKIEYAMTPILQKGVSLAPSALQGYKDIKGILHIMCIIYSIYLLFQ